MNFFRSQSQFTMSLNYRYIIYNDDTSLSLPEFNKLLGRLGQRTRYVTPKKINLSKFRKNNSFRLVSTFHQEPLLKIDNLQYNTLICWFTGTNDQTSDVPGIIFLIISDRLRVPKTLYFYFCKSIRKKNKLK